FLAFATVLVLGIGISMLAVRSLDAARRDDDLESLPTAPAAGAGAAEPPTKPPAARGVDWDALGRTVRQCSLRVHREIYNSLLFVLRAVEIDGGVSPLVPLITIGLGLAAWSGWHLQRIELLMASTPFERALQRRAADDPWARALADIRSHLFLVVPDPEGLYF